MFDTYHKYGPWGNVREVYCTPFERVFDSEEERREYEEERKARERGRPEPFERVSCDYDATTGKFTF